MFRNPILHFSNYFTANPFKMLVAVLFVVSCSHLVTATMALSTPSASPAQAGRFIPMPPTFASGGVPQQVITADVNKDGVADLIVSNGNGKITLLLGKGKGAFAPASTIASVTGGAPQIVIGDFNRDGVPDLAVLVKSASSVWILVGHGDGTFALPTKRSTPPSPAQIRSEEHTS